MTYGKQTYLGFILWGIGVISCLLVLPKIVIYIWPLIDPSTVVKMIMEFLLLAVVVLLFIILMTQRIYWIYGMSYDRAAQMTPGERKSYGMRFLRSFTMALAVLTVYNIFGMFVGTRRVVDICIALLIIFGTAIYTMKISERT